MHSCLFRLTILTTVTLEGIASAQLSPIRVPGTAICVQANGSAGGQVHGGVQATVRPSGSNVTANGSVGAQADANANTQGRFDGNGKFEDQPQGAYPPNRPSYTSVPIRYGTGVTFCGALKAGVFWI